MEIDLRRLMVWKSVCPLCRTDMTVYILDKGTKFWNRFFRANNRFACEHCNVTWRRRKNYSWSHLIDPDDIVAEEPDRIDVDKIRNL